MSELTSSRTVLNLSLNRVLTRTDTLNHAESYVYDLAGNLVRLTDRKG